VVCHDCAFGSRAQSVLQHKGLNARAHIGRTETAKHKRQNTNGKTQTRRRRKKKRTKENKFSGEEENEKQKVSKQVDRKV
jgi:hypothetical protein